MRSPRIALVVLAVSALAAALASCATPASPAPVAAVTTTPAITVVPTATQTRTPTATVGRTTARTPKPTRTPPKTLLVQQMADTRGARQVITVTTAGGSAVLQAFELTAAGWRLAFGPVPAVIGAQGFSTRVSEQTTATPIGMFTLTEAFGTAADPGTALPYRRSQYGDVWVDQASAPTYNTRQTGDADFGKGSGERLWKETTAYEYAVVIDYNRRPVRAGAGSAFFLHVTIPVPSQGCVTVREDRLRWLLRWLNPAAHPVIAMGPEATVRKM